MKKKLFQEVFNKAKNQSGKTSKHGLSGHLERVLMDEFRFSVSKITFVRYYEKYIDELSTGGNNPNVDLLDKMCEYLGYENYEDFVARNDAQIENRSTGRHIAQDSEKSKKGDFFSYLNKHRITLIISLVLIVGFIVFESINERQWMIWQEDKYIEVSFDAERYNIGELELYNEDRIQNFSKVTPNCDTKFFKESGDANLWYGKNEKDTLEYFTTFGKHPKTGKTLKEITGYMIKKHICETY